ncbi:MAG: TIGR02147 family protein [Deltaproteobacteria bacterium]|nr:TIGR02147 family protein [Deltaproteobacteria bacterium]
MEIFEYSDYCDYLCAYLKHHRQRNRGFRLRDLSEKAGFHSPSLLSMALRRRRPLSQGAAEKLARALSLRGKRKKYFLAMVRSSTERKNQNRKMAQESMFLLKHQYAARPMELEQYRFLATWFYPVLYTMVGIKHFRSDPHWLAEKLGRGVSAKQVGIALADLVKLGLLKCVDGQYTQLAFNLTTSEDVKNVAVHRYHHEMNELAKASFNLPLDEREINGVTIAIPKKMLSSVKEKLRHFRREIAEWLSAFEVEASDVYQLNLHLFPVTANLSDEGKNAP